MKVVLVGDYPKDDRIETGVQGVLVGLTMALLKRNDIEPVLVSLNPSGIAERYGSQCSTYVLNMRASYFQARKEFYRICKNEKADVIHLQGVVPGVLLYRKTFADRFIVTQHAIYSKERQQQVSKWRKFKFQIKELIERYYLRQVQNIIFISDYNKEVFKEEIKALEYLNHQTIPNPVNGIFNYQDNSVRPQGNEFYFIGELKKRKGLHVLIRALALLKKKGVYGKLHVIGGFKERTYERQIHKEIADLDIEDEIVFCGWKTPSESIDYTRNIPVLVLPSFQETLPLSIAEAMTMGKLVVATKVGGISEMIEHDSSGLLFEPGDHKSLAQILADIINDPIHYAKVAENGRRESLKFNEEVVTQQTIDFYRTIVNKNQA